MIYADKNRRLSFLNLEPSLSLFKDQRIFNKSLPKSSSGQRKLKLDRQIFTSLSRKMRKSRISDKHNQHKLSLPDEIFNSAPSMHSHIFLRNFSLASLKISGTSIPAELPEQKSFAKIEKKEKSCKLASEKPISIKKNKKSSSIQHLLTKSRPKLTTKNIFSTGGCTKYLNSAQTARTNKPEPSDQTPAKPKCDKLLISPLLNFKKITIKSTQNKQQKTHTDRVELKVEMEDLDLSGW